MPTAALPRCASIGCTNRAEAGTHGRCAEHTRAAWRKAPDSGWADVDTHRWRRMRNRYLAEHPLCAHCSRRLAAELDHVISLAAGGPMWDATNWQGLCKPCHRAKTLADKRLTT